MPLRLVFRPEVGRDLANAYRWYEERYRGLGEEFLAEVESAFDRIEQHPETFAIRYERIRLALVARFPYAVFYRNEPTRAVVLAVLHTADDTNKWPRAK